MDFERVSPKKFGKLLTGLGINILVRDVDMHAQFLPNVFGMGVHQLSSNFAILVYGDDIFQMHADATYSKHPLLSLLPETPPRGAGIEIRLYHSDPDQCHLRALERNATIPRPPQDKPHNLRECAILSHDGYVWVPSRPLGV